MMKIVCLTAVVLGNIIFFLPAYAQVAPCSQRAPLIWSLQFAAPLDEWLRPAYRIWGTQNLAIRQDGGTNVLEVTYPKGSIDPATTTAPAGGAVTGGNARGLSLGTRRCEWPHYTWRGRKKKKPAPGAALYGSAPKTPD